MAGVGDDGGFACGKIFIAVLVGHLDAFWSSIVLRKIFSRALVPLTTKTQVLVTR